MAKESVNFMVSGIDGKHDVKRLKKELDTLRGVSSVSVNEQSASIAIDYDSTGVDRSAIREKIEAQGFEIVNMHADEHKS